MSGSSDPDATDLPSQNAPEARDSEESAELLETGTTCDQCQSVMTSGGLDEDFVVCQTCGDMSVIEESETRDLPNASLHTPQLSRYQFIKNIGRGSFGVVFKALDSDLNREVAVKTAIRNVGHRDVDLFLREARATSQLAHPNIVRIYDFVKSGNKVFIVSELVEGVSLRTYLHESEESLDTHLKLMITLCRAIDHAHAHSVVHRDLKPGNIMVDREGQPHVLDFGLSQSIDSALETISKEGVPLGTPAYMSPEQVRGSRDEIDQRTDIYSLGVILFQSLTGKLPFVGDKESMYERILFHIPPSPRKFNPRVSKSLCQIVEKALRKSPDERYQTAGALADDLQRFLDGEMISVGSPLESRVVKAKIRKHAPWILFAFAMTVLVLWTLFQPERSPASKNTTLVTLQTNPPKSVVSFIPISPDTGLDIPEQSTLLQAGKPTSLKPGFYRVRAYFPEHGETIEVFRTVPDPTAKERPVARLFCGVSVPLLHLSWWKNEDGSFELGEIRHLPEPIDDKDFSIIAGGEIKIPEDVYAPKLLTAYPFKIPDMAVAITEVSWDRLAKTWPGITPPSGQSLFVTGIEWDVAVAFAEANGMSLPNAWELIYISTNGGKTTFPNGDATPNADFDELLLQDWDQTNHRTPVQGLLTGVPEYTETAFRIVDLKDGKLVNPAGNSPANQSPEKVLSVAKPFLESRPPTVLFRLKATSVVNSDEVGFRLIRRLYSTPEDSR